MKAEIAYEGGFHAVEEALEPMNEIARRAGRAASKAGNVATDSHRQMVADWASRLEPEVAL